MGVIKPFKVEHKIRRRTSLMKVWRRGKHGGGQRPVVISPPSALSMTQPGDRLGRFGRFGLASHTETNWSDRTAAQNRRLTARPPARGSTRASSCFAMLQLVLAALVTGLLYVLLVETLFKKSQCKGKREMSGRTVIITGGNTGIGKATAMELAGRGARVILACRNQQKAELAISDIMKVTGSTDVVYMQLDLSSLRSVRSFTEIFLKTEPRLDLLINNAGLIADGRTEDGFGIEFGVNHLGHFLLTCLLLDRLKESPEGRVITMSSMAHRWGKIDFDALVANKDLGTGRYSWQFFQAYCNSKLCNVLFTHELAKRLKGTNVTCYSVHPGIVKTELSRHVSLWQKVFIEPVAWLLFLDPTTGAQTTLHCALQEGIEALSGRYFSCCAVQDVSAKAKDDAVAKKLWEVSERLSGLS